MRILCFGAREWVDLELIVNTLRFYKNLDSFDNMVVIEGECRGADQLSRDAALSLGVRDKNILRFPAKWTELGKAAGPIRNQQMLDEGEPTLGIMFHDNLEASRGSKDMMTRLLNAWVPIVHVSHSSVIHIGEYHGSDMGK